MAELLYRVGRFSARRAWVVIATWAVLLGLAGGAFALWAGSLTNNFDIPGTATAEVTDELAAALPDVAGAAGTVVLATEDGSALSASQRTQISALAAGATDLPHVSSVVDPFATEEQRTQEEQQLADAPTQIEAGQTQLDAAQTQLDAAVAAAQAAGTLQEQQSQLDAQQTRLTEQQTTLDDQREQAQIGSQLLQLATEIRSVSTDGSAATVTIVFDVPSLELPDDAKNAVIEDFQATEIPGVQVSFDSQIAQTVPDVIGVGEVVGVLIAGLVLLVMLGTLVAAGLPLLNALVGVGVGVLTALSLSAVVDMSAVTPVLGVMLGLAVGIDYSLFIINRHRRKLAHGMDPHESIGLANGTAGNAVVFAGCTVVIALLALNITGIPFIGTMGTVGALCIAVAVLVAVTLTPAMLGLVGTRVLARRSRSPLRSAAPAPAPVPPRAMSTRRAVASVGAAALILLVAAIPALSMRLGLPDGSSDPVDSTTYQAYTTVSEKFGAGYNGTLLVTAHLSAGLDEDALLAQQLTIAQAIAGTDDVLAVAPIGVSDDTTLAAFQVLPATGPSAAETEQLVHTLRATTVTGTEGTLGVAGQASGNIDISEKLADALPVYIAIVIGLSLIILIAVFRSLLVPLIATAGFMLSIFATFGALVAVFQWGWLGPVFGVTVTGPILSFLPIILVGILFGLAMDYQLFLGSGMREAYVHGATARDAVVRGFHAGRSVVTAAALIMIAVFGGFVFSESSIIRALGLGLAFGVLVDAFVVRMLLMPALMHLAGDAAWWLPRWLRRILPDLDVEGARLERSHPTL